jgi:predicted phosphodiesterase
MTPPPPIMENLPEKKSILVFSDHHLGGTVDTGTSARFSRFLDYLVNPATSDEREKLNLYPPAKVILLGDIFDFWDPLDQDRDNVFIDGITPFLKLGRLCCDIIYVTGNHDEDIGDIADALEKRGMQNKIPLLDKNNLSIFKRVYPGNNQSLDIGGVRYSFPHGQQFDIQQITNVVSECLGNRFDPVDFIEDLANISFTKSLPRWFNWMMFIAFFSLLAINGNPLLQGWIPAVTVFIWILLFLLLLGVFLLFAVVFRKKIASGFIALVLFIPLLALGILFWLKLPWTNPGPFFEAILVAGFFFVCAISIPRLFVYGKRLLYSGFNPKETTLREMAEQDSRLRIFKRMRRILRPEEVAPDANVIVFGHTHWADVYLYTLPQFALQRGTTSPASGSQIKYLLFNSGGWDRIGAKQKQRSGDIIDNAIIGTIETIIEKIDDIREFLIAKKILKRTPSPPKSPFADRLDTFVYIDNDGLRLMEWHDDPKNANGGKIDRITVYTKGMIASMTGISNTPDNTVIPPP